MRTTLLLCLAIWSARLPVTAQDCDIPGSTTIYDLRHDKWHYTDPADAFRTALPASTFKIINLLIALETGVIADENAIVRWPGSTDTVKYGYRPDIYRDMSVREAFELSAGWVYVELAKKIGKERYAHYLKASGYGNGDVSQPDADFWNFGAFGISPANQIEFLVKVYREKGLPFSARNIAILKSVMITDKKDAYVIRSKTGWTRDQGKDTGWWVGYVERKDNVYFFATRLVKDRKTVEPGFSQCRKTVTLDRLKALRAL
ncbi:penicillin-binding transpeptidase domain-containing protein [Chitinophaga lutea]